MGAINFRNGAISPGQIGYTSDSRMTFKVNSIDNFMTLKNEANHIEMSNGALLTSDGVWTNAPLPPSFIRHKHLIDYGSVLEKVEQLPIFVWNSNSDRSRNRIGPEAALFNETFGTGEENDGIAPSNVAAVALAGIKALHQENNVLKDELAQLKSQINQINKLILNNEESSIQDINRKLKDQKKIE